MTSVLPPPQIARVISVSGARVVALLESADATGTEPGDDRSGPQIGEVVKMVTDLATVYGLVTAIRIPLEHLHPGEDLRHHAMRIAEIELLGEIEHDVASRPGDRERRPDGANRFQRGISRFPSLDDAIYRSDQDDLSHIFIQPDLDSVRIGTLHQDRAVPAYIVPDNLLSKHFAVLGTTGSGKSCAVATILRAILQQHDKAHIVILDPHNEYIHGFGDMAERVSPVDLELPYWLLNFEELAEMVLGNLGRNAVAEMAVLNQFVTKAKRDLPQNHDWKDHITVDTPVPYRLSDVIKQIDEVLGKLEKPTDLQAYLRVRERLQALQADPRYAFMFPGLILRDNMSKIISRLFRVPVHGKPISIIDISSLPTEILNVVVSLLFRMVFDFALWSDRSVPLLLICEEAHRYAPAAEQTAFEPSKRGLMRIAREGRKYGVSLCLVSQRPSELSTTVLSQCSTIFSLRLTNGKDQDYLAAVLPEASISLMTALPALRNGEAVAVGEGVPVPARIRFDRLPEAHQPRSQDAPFASAWSHETQTADFLDQVVDRWRHQR